MTLLRESAEFNDPYLKSAEFATLIFWGLALEIQSEIHKDAYFITYLVFW